MSEIHAGQSTREFEWQRVACVEARCPSVMDAFGSRDFSTPMRVNIDREAESSYQSVPHGQRVCVSGARAVKLVIDVWCWVCVLVLVGWQGPR